MAFDHLSISRTGEYSRVADPSWSDALDTSYSGIKGGRWNPPPLQALYLNQSMTVALANARRLIESTFAASLEDVREDRLPDLQLVTVAEGGVFLDAVTPNGIAKLKLPTSYPSGVPHPPCQAIADDASRAGLDGVSTLSAVAPAEEELVVFGGSILNLVARGARTPFGVWSVHAGY